MCVSFANTWLNLNLNILYVEFEFLNFGFNVFSGVRMEIEIEKCFDECMLWYMLYSCTKKHRKTISSVQVCTDT